MGLLDDRAVVITGAGRGLGRSYAVSAARQVLGAVVNDIDIDEAERVVAEIRHDGGRRFRLRRLCRGRGQCRTSDRACVFRRSVGWTASSTTRLSTTTSGCRGTSRQTRSRPRSRSTSSVPCTAQRTCDDTWSLSVVAASSTSPRRGIMGQSGMAVYSTTKGALASATYSQAGRDAPQRARANAVCPSAATRAYDIAGEHAEYARAHVGSPDLVAPVFVYLLSDLSRDVTGQIIVMMRLQAELDAAS